MEHESVHRPAAERCEAEVRTDLQDDEVFGVSFAIRGAETQQAVCLDMHAQKTCVACV